MILSIPIYLSFTLFYSREKKSAFFVHNDGDAAESVHRENINLETGR